MKTAYLGPEASFSHQAALEALPATTAAPLASFAAIFAALQAQPSEYDYGVLPVENSTNGAVVQSLDLLALCGLNSSSSLYEDVEVVAEYYLSVHHYLFVTQAAIQSLSPEYQQILSAGSTFSGEEHQQNLKEVLQQLKIKTLFTHPQVWGQCGKFLGTHLPPGKVERVDMSSTSAAAGFIAKNSLTQNGSETPSGCIAAISPLLAGQKNRLVCIAEQIEDHPGENTTRFLVLRNRKREPQVPIPDTSIALKVIDSQPPTTLTDFKSLITFTIPHSTPGSLASALSVFSKHGFNLTAIQSRPSHIRNWHYVFFVECKHQSQSNAGSTIDSSHANGDETGNAKLDAMLEDLKDHTERARWLGSWRDRLQKPTPSGT